MTVFAPWYGTNGNEANERVGIDAANQAMLGQSKQPR